MQPLEIELVKPIRQVPDIRFKQYTGLWDTAKLEDLMSPLKSGVSVNSEDRAIKDSTEYGILKTSCVARGIFHSQENKKIVPDEVSCARLKPNKDSILISRMNTPMLVGESGYVPQDYNNLYIPDRLWLARAKSNKTSTRWLSYWLIRVKTRHLLKSIATGTSGTMKNISKPNFLSLELSIPSLPEQQKISAFLSAVDKKIQQLTRKKALLEEYKKGVMQKLFPSAGSGQAPEIRFKDENGEEFPEWEEKRLGDVFTRITIKNKEDNQNVLTISAQYGLINQKEYFNKSVAAKDLTGYYLLERDYFAYNKSYSKGYPMGAIKRLTRYSKGVVSTLYICFRIAGGDSPDYYAEYLDHGMINRELHKIAQEGARNHGLLNMSVKEFFDDVKIHRPCVEEQQKIASFLQVVNAKLNVSNERLAWAINFKKGLLQQMFV
jgi:type I restriction enzyme, S subunit